MKNLIIEAALSAPPSEVSCFRDITLYSKTYIFEDVLLVCEEGTRSFYWEWLKRHGAHDFVSYLLKDTESESGFFIGSKNANLNIDSFNIHNLNFIISVLKSRVN